MNILCEHKESRKKGIIKNEMTGNERFPDQWGIFWTITYDKNTPNHYYWNDKDKITILNQHP